MKPQTESAGNACKNIFQSAGEACRRRLRRWWIKTLRNAVDRADEWVHALEVQSRKVAEDESDDREHDEGHHPGGRREGDPGEDLGRRDGIRDPFPVIRYPRGRRSEGGQHAIRKGIAGVPRAIRRCASDSGSLGSVEIRPAEKPRRRGAMTAAEFDRKYSRVTSHESPVTDSL